MRPVALSPDKRFLFAVNTPAGTLEILKIGRRGLQHVDSVRVGLEPVAVAVRNRSEVWVVNHLSDSVSILRKRDDSGRRRGSWHVANTLYVGDEPRDIVFAKSRRQSKKAFITTAHRGQNIPHDPQFTEPGVGRADIWVFEAKKAWKSDVAGGEPLTILTLFTDTPRALAASPDGSRVYAAGFLTGNGTTVIPEEVVTNTQGLPEPTTNFEGVLQPPTSLIVKYDGQHWRDELGRTWDEHVYFSLPDEDVFVIDNRTHVPTVSASESYAGVGTVLFNMAVHPATGEVFVTNTDARNEERFEGEGYFAGHSLRGRFLENRISILQPNGNVLHRDLNKHIDHDVPCCDAPSPQNKAKALALPMGLQFPANGRYLFVAAFGSDKIGVFRTRKLRNDSFEPNENTQISLSGGGPSGFAIDEEKGLMYVMTRFNNAISVVDLEAGAEVGSFAFFNPEPRHIVEGRRFLYDAQLTSANGDHSCAGCHVFGNLDGLAWDLGDPDISEINNPGPFTLTPETAGMEASVHFRPLKGPMTTQSLRGLDNHGPMHWRGDRTGGNDEASHQPNSGSFDEKAALRQFNGAFVGVNGNDQPLTSEQFRKFSEFVLDLTYPPNPVKNLDNSLTDAQQFGHDFYFDRISDRFFACNGCHPLDPDGNAEHGVRHPGFFGTDGSYSFEFEPQTMKIPHC
ncbi:hypothetical protein [Candidatus Thiosymbion oneisti]|uniref:hypothetical protein n=1 Tax=Candidatus Thiosymbion oneisti TaxID=589554 RepID=UPI000B7DA120|nr:hypothetical protein [Candidatus Thiosymbion oneisti]